MKWYLRYHIHTLNLTSSMAAIVFSRWLNINSVHPLGNMKSNFKYKVDWGNGS